MNVIARCINRQEVNSWWTDHFGHASPIDVDYDWRKIARFDWDRAFDLRYLTWFYLNEAASDFSKK